MVIDLSNPKQAVGLVSAVALALVVLYFGASRGFPLVKRVGRAVGGKFSHLAQRLKRKRVAKVAPEKRVVLDAVAVVAGHFEAKGDAKTVAAMADIASRVLTEPVKVPAV